MTQVITPVQPLPPVPAGGPSHRARDGRLASSLVFVRAYFSGSPGHLRITAVVTVLAALVVGIGGGLALRERSAALDEAKTSAVNLILVQSVQIRLAQADADVTNSFLGFGLEPVAKQLDFVASLQAASHDLAVAASGSSEDSAALGAANAALTRYASYIGSARANNREGNPVGANYLTTANSLLQDEVLSKLAARATADGDKINSAYSRASRAGWWLALVAVLGLGALIGAQVYLARRTRRILNVPLAAATVGVLVALIAGAAAMSLAQSRANTVREGDLADARDLSASRVAAFTAKSTESLTLINRGSATQADSEWTTLMATATATLSSDDGVARRALSDYAQAHQAINAQDVNGQWDAAVKDATATGDDSANKQFALYASSTDDGLKESAAAASSGLDKAGNALLPAGILVVLTGLLAAFGAWWGVSLRLDEYR